MVVDGGLNVQLGGDKILHFCLTQKDAGKNNIVDLERREEADACPQSSQGVAGDLYGLDVKFGEDRLQLGQGTGGHSTARAEGGLIKFDFHKQVGWADWREVPGCYWLNIVLMVPDSGCTGTNVSRFLFQRLT